MNRVPMWHKKAKELRAEGLTFREIAEQLNRSLNGVYNICRHVECPVQNRGRPLNEKEWYKEAKGLRAEGHTLQSIADRFGVSRERIRQITIDIKCPVNNRGGDRRSETWNK